MPWRCIWFTRGEMHIYSVYSEVNTDEGKHLVQQRPVEMHNMFPVYISLHSIKRSRPPPLPHLREERKS